MIQIRLAVLLTLVTTGIFGVNACDSENNVDMDPETTPLASTLKSSYDYIIVGGGSAGSVLASRLSENNETSVLLVEAGPDDRNDPSLVVPLAGAVNMNGPRDYLYYTVPDERYFGLNNNQTLINSGKVLGGGSSINVMVYCRGSRHDFDRWATYTGDETWDYPHVLSYFIKAEGAQGNLKDSPYHGNTGPLSVTPGPYLNITDILMDAAEEAGFQRNPDYNGESMMGAAYGQSTRLNGERMSASRAYLRPALTRPNLDVAANTWATRVVIENDKAIGVELTRDQETSNPISFTVQATSEVILSAGSLQTPKLLMLSGVGPREHLNAFNIPVRANLPVGKNYQNHPIIILTYKMDQDLALRYSDVSDPDAIEQYAQNKTGPLSSPYGFEANIFEAFDPEDKSIGWPQVQLHLIAFPGSSVQLEAANYKPQVVGDLSGRDNVLNGFQMGCNIARPESRGEVLLRSKCPFDDPSIRANYFDNQDDVEILLKTIRSFERIVDTTAFKRIGVSPTEDFTYSPCKEFQYNTDDFWRCQIKSTFPAAYHPSGTCKMGPRGDPTAVVDSELRVQGIDNLRVVDASIMPWVTSCNIEAPTIMIAEKAADLIRNNDPLPPTNI